MTIILCAEDDAAIRSLLLRSLEAAGYACVLAEDGLEAVQLASEMRLDLIVLDVMMPNMDGHEAFDKIRELPAHTDTPIMFLTALGEPEDVVRGYGLGADDYVTKPFLPSVLLAKIKVVLDRHRPPAPDLTDAPSEVVLAADNPNRVLDKYVILREIGRGGTGVVYKAWDTRLSVMVALKFLNKQRRPGGAARFQKEASTIARLHHPNICRVYDVLEQDGRCYLAVQFIDGQPIDEIDHGPEPFGSAAGLLAQVAKALMYTHEQGVIHCDVKPRNILVDASRHPYIVDFGSARREDEEDLIAVGSPSYMAPEVARSAFDAIGPRTDVYSLGATLYRLITGRPPFVGETGLEVLRQVIHDSPVPPSEVIPGVPEQLEQICLRAMMKMPGARYQGMAELGDALDAACYSQT